MTLNRLATAVRSRLLTPTTSSHVRGRQLRQLSRLGEKPKLPSKMGIHHLMVGTWTPPGAIFTFAFDDEALTLKLVKRTEIAQDEPISWMTFDVSSDTQSKKDNEIYIS